MRRKIRNKQSAQDSRRRRKEYLDGLESRWGLAAPWAAVSPCPPCHPRPLPVSARAGQPPAQPRTRSCGRKSRSWSNSTGEPGAGAAPERGGGTAGGHRGDPPLAPQVSAAAAAGADQANVHQGRADRRLRPGTARGRTGGCPLPATARGHMRLLSLPRRSCSSPWGSSSSPAPVPSAGAQGAAGTATDPLEVLGELGERWSGAEGGSCLHLPTPRGVSHSRSDFQEHPDMGGAAGTGRRSSVPHTGVVVGGSARLCGGR